jgi:hypothetical protein
MMTFARAQQPEPIAMKTYDPGSAAELRLMSSSQARRDAHDAMREVDLIELEVSAAGARSSDEAGAAPTLQAACAVLGGLLLLGLLGYVIAAMGLNLAGEIPETEYWSSLSTIL